METGNSRGWANTVVTVVLSSFVGAAFGIISSLFVLQYQQTTNTENLKTAYLAEIRVILTAVRGPAMQAAAAWENKRRLADYKFYYPRAVFDGNVAHLGELRDKKLVHDIAYLYSALERAFEEGRRLETANSPPEEQLRYTYLLCMALIGSMNLATNLSGESPTEGRTESERRFDEQELKRDTAFLISTMDKIWDVLLPPDQRQPTNNLPH